MLIRDQVFEKYEWLKPHHLNEETIIMGDDLDAALSTVLYLHLYPNSKLIGVYKGYTDIFFSSRFSWQDVLNSVWLDLDIYHPACRSLGHHIIRKSKQDKLEGFHNSCNINEVFERDHTTFQEKYPLGTIHILMWLYGLDIPTNENADLLMWLADSSFINRQKYAANFQNWIHNRIPLISVQNDFPKVETRDFEVRMESFQETMRKRGFQQGHGQVTSTECVNRLRQLV